MVNCPTCGRTDTVQTLADRFYCLNDAVYFGMDGVVAAGGLAWTSEVPVSVVVDADVTVAAFDAQTEE